MARTRKRKLGQLDGSETTPQSLTRQKMDVPASLPENKAEEGDVNSAMPTTDAFYFSGRIIIIAVGPDKTKFYIHEQVLFQVAKNSHFHTAFNNVFEILVKWIYAAHAGIDDWCDIFAPLNLLMLFKVYVVAHNHLVYGIQDIVMTHVWMELCYSSSIWSKIGSDKKALECFRADVPENSHLYRLVVRATAYSMLQPTAAHDHSNDRGAAGDVCLDFHRPTNTKAQVEDFLRAVPDRICRSIVETILSVKTLGCCKEFEDVVGTEKDFHLKEQS